MNDETGVPQPQQHSANSIVLDGSIVRVTHVESPVWFYCRSDLDEDRFAALQRKIATHIESTVSRVPELDPENFADNGDVTSGTGSNFVLVYSIIRGQWCRGRVLSCQRRTTDTVANNYGSDRPISAKVCLIDYGSIEIVLWHDKYVQSSSPSIDAVNDYRGFCFRCALGEIEPYNDGDRFHGKPHQPYPMQWSSYANYLIEKETKNRRFWIRTIRPPISVEQQLPTYPSRRNFVICDLSPIDSGGSDAYQPQQQQLNFDSQTQFESLSDYLVASNVARYPDLQRHPQFKSINRTSSNGDEDSSERQSDDEKENIFILTNC